MRRVFSKNVYRHAVSWFGSENYRKAFRCAPRMSFLQVDYRMLRNPLLMRSGSLEEVREALRVSMTGQQAPWDNCLGLTGMDITSIEECVRKCLDSYTSAWSTIFHNLNSTPQLTCKAGAVNRLCVFDPYGEGCCCIPKVGKSKEANGIDAHSILHISHPIPHDDVIQEPFHVYKLVRSLFQLPSCTRGQHSKLRRQLDRLHRQATRDIKMRIKMARSELATYDSSRILSNVKNALMQVPVDRWKHITVSDRSVARQKAAFSQSDKKKRSCSFDKEEEEFNNFINGLLRRIDKCCESHRKGDSSEDILLDILYDQK
ncbi:hypothetical protein BgAZ_106880 [Babesia gibsoni]|uniref:Uncharacterized protein n=1 Tax=Babesia gibsoni TaxID=33632 RepID=A0AAD8PG89_BABGI|nr:hypothetical protein BgAZ_106880 [Babesia gibsoni]